MFCVVEKVWGAKELIFRVIPRSWTRKSPSILLKPLRLDLDGSEIHVVSTNLVATLTEKRLH